MPESDNPYESPTSSAEEEPTRSGAVIQGAARGARVGGFGVGCVAVAIVPVLIAVAEPSDRPQTLPEFGQFLALVAGGVLSYAFMGAVLGSAIMALMAAVRFRLDSKR